jgi:hypothetical protein
MRGFPQLPSFHEKSQELEIPMKRISCSFTKRRVSKREVLAKIHFSITG